MRVSRLYVTASLSTGHPVKVDPDLAHYVTRTLRLRTGDEVIVFNGSGDEHHARVVVEGRGAVSLEPYSTLTPERESPLKVILSFGIVRHERMDFAIQKAVELGVNSIEPLEMQYSVVSLDSERMRRRHRHWEGVIRSACEQSGRVRLPFLRMPEKFASWLSTRDPVDREFILSPRGNQALSDMSSIDLSGMRIRTLIGPEGGFSDQEKALATDAGFIELHLGPRILRTETAAIMAVGALQLTWGGWRRGIESSL